jgi:arylsulfatase A-like enzyme
LQLDGVQIPRRGTGQTGAWPDEIQIDAVHIDMNKARSLVLLRTTLALVGSLSVVDAMPQLERPPHEEPMNVLLVVLDDVGSDKLRQFDELWAPPYARTPRLDALAEGGIRFRNFYADPVCSASRACIQTGRHTFRNGMGSNSEIWELPSSEVLLPELLRHGFAPGRSYRCGAFGKWHLGETNAAHVVDNGYERFYGSLGNTADHFLWTKTEHDEGSAPLQIPMSAWSASIARADAVRWINAQVKPFFAYVAFNPPHQKWQVPPKALLSDATTAELEGFAEGQDALPSQRQLFYRAMLEAVDTEVGNLIDGIDRQKRENTMIFVVCDNGTERQVVTAPHDSRHGKPTVYQLGIRVPMIVSGPLVPDQVPTGGFDCRALVCAVDFWHTIAEITGADETRAFEELGFSEPYPELDSVSFLPQVQSPWELGSRALAFSQVFGPPGAFRPSQCMRVNLRAITDGEYKYIRSMTRDPDADPCSTPVYVNEFFHVAVDPEETHDLLQYSLMASDQRRILSYLQLQMDILSEF